MKLVFLRMCHLLWSGRVLHGKRFPCVLSTCPPLGSGFIGISGRCLGNQSEPHLVAENGIRKAM